MYSHENYIWGLVAYGVGFICILPMVLIVTRKLIPWTVPRNLIRLFFVALLLTPVKAYTDMYYLAPAWMVAAFEFVRPTSVEGPARAVSVIVLSFGALVLAYLLWLIVRHIVYPRLLHRKPAGDHRA